jgi:hypothetical protein
MRASAVVNRQLSLRASLFRLLFHAFASFRICSIVVKHGQETVLPLTPEFIRNEDGQEKQDCERNAAKRWLERNAEHYRWLNPVFLGDDLYTDYPTGRAIVEKRMHFLFTCKPDSHP